MKITQLLESNFPFGTTEGTPSVERYPDEVLTVSTEFIGGLVTRFKRRSIEKIDAKRFDGAIKTLTEQKTKSLRILAGLTGKDSDPVVIKNQTLLRSLNCNGQSPKQLADAIKRDVQGQHFVLTVYSDWCNRYIGMLYGALRQADEGKRHEMSSFNEIVRLATPGERVPDIAFKPDTFVLNQYLPDFTSYLKENYNNISDDKAERHYDMLFLQPPLLFKTHEKETLAELTLTLGDVRKIAKFLDTITQQLEASKKYHHRLVDGILQIEVFRRREGNHDKEYRYLNTMFINSIANLEKTQTSMLQHAGKVATAIMELIEQAAKA